MKNTKEVSEKKQCDMHVVSRSIVITGDVRGFKITTKELLFNNEYIKIDEITDNYIVFSTPAIDYNGKMYKTHKVGNFMQVGITNERLIAGKFYVSVEESTGDELVVYYG
jgi:hypothetical protein